MLLCSPTMRHPHIVSLHIAMNFMIFSRHNFPSFIADYIAVLNVCFMYSLTVAATVDATALRSAPRKKKLTNVARIINFFFIPYY